MQIELGAKVVSLLLACELTKLSELSIDHNYIVTMLLLWVGYKDTPVRLISWVVFAIKPNACTLTCADIFIFVKNINQMASNSTSMDETEASFLYYSPSADSITHKLNYKKSNSILKLWEDERLTVTDVSRLFICVLDTFRGVKTVQIDCSIEMF
jgi:hypothetical protein